MTIAGNAVPHQSLQIGLRPGLRRPDAMNPFLSKKIDRNEISIAVCVIGTESDMYRRDQKGRPHEILLRT
jgi:hypothetical protein